MTYDAAGNLTNDTYTGAGNRTYDAENKITSAWGGNNQAQLYSYDASGQRIKRTVDGVETWQVYGFGGELVAEYSANGAVGSPQKEYGYRNGQLLITASSGGAALGLACYSKFDENSGTTASDSSGNGNTGTLTSGTGWATGQNGSAVNFDGVDDYVQVGAQSSLVMTSAASLSAWIYPTGAGSNATYGGTILVKEGEYIVARYPNGKIHWGFANSNPGWTFIDTGHVAPLNQWTHIAVTYDNGTIKTYANGSLVHTHNGSGAIGDAITGQNDFRVGGQQAISQHFQGRIDEVRVYNRALSASEVSSVPNGAPSGGLDLRWLVADQLGTPRMIIDQTGSLANVKRHDYLPFGEELFAPTGGRSAAQGYGCAPGQPGCTGDQVRQQFTQKERDIETGLDYFLARYYSSTQGRFTSPDEFTGGPNELYMFVRDAANNPTFYSEPDNPQSLNKYQYTYNNPLRYTDPDGHCPVCPVAQRIVQSPTGQQVINAAGAAATTTVVVASGALKKAWDWFTTPNPNSKGNTVCGMGLDCSGAYSNQYRNQSNQQNSSGNQGQQQAQGQSNTASPGNNNDEKPPFGSRGTQTTSTTVYQGGGRRIDVENPNPGQRAGQIHYQSGKTKLLYDPNTKSFIGASKSLNKQLMNDPQIQKAIQKGLKILGESQ